MARRGKGEGSIRHRPDGRYEARYEAVEPGGQRRRRSLFGKTRTEVQDKLRDALKRKSDNIPEPSATLTLSAFLTRWLDGKNNLRPESRRRYHDSIKLHLVPQIGRKSLAKLTAVDLQDCYGKLRDRGLSGTTVSHAHGVLRTALKDATRWDLVTRNVADLVDRPQRSTQEMTSLTPQEAARLLLAARGDPLEAFYITALTTGLRLGELQALQWRQVDLDGHRMQVVATLAAVVDGGPVLAPPKTAKSRRTVTLSEIASEALRDHRLRQLEQRLLVGQHWQDNDLVFCNGFGRPLDANNVRERSFKRLLKRAELPPMRFHNLRHAAASLLLAEGVGIKVISEMLGHADITVTLKIYAHLMPSAQEQAAGAMDRLFGAAGT